MAKWAAIVVALTGGILLYWAVGTRDADMSREARSMSGGVAKGSLSPDAVLSIAPRAQSAIAPIAPNARFSPLMQEYRSAKSYAALHARLSKSGDRSPEEQWVLAQILKRCAKFADSGLPMPAKNPVLKDPEARSRYIASLGVNDPDRDKRIAAFDAVNYDVCGPLASLEATQRDIRELVAASAAGGDPKARVELLQENITEQVRGSDGKFSGAMPRIDDAQMEILKQVMNSGDPYAMRGAAGLLAGSYGNMSLRDADDRPVDLSAFYIAATLLACDYGLPCGADTMQVQQGCAMNGNCAANNYRDYMLYYAASPSTSQQVAGYEAALRRGAQNNDWSGFVFRPGPSPSVAPYMGRGGP
jgi:hypothetical protein